jgi:hypothetical protein
MKVINLILIPILLLTDAAIAAKPKRTATFPERVLAVGSDTIEVRIRAKAGSKITDIDPVTGAKTVEAPDNFVTYHVVANAEITVDGLPSKLSDVRTGMKIIVDCGASPTEAVRIVANTVPPPVPKAAADAQAAKPKPPGKKGAVKQAFRKISIEKVIAIRADRITAAQDGAAQAVAYFITPMTNITVNGQPGATGDIKPGMSVEINSSDQYNAASIKVVGDNR